MKMVEQNISGVKLEQLRQNAVKKHKILRKLLPVCLILFIGLTLVKNRFLFVSISEYGFGDPATQGAFWGLIGGMMLSVILRVLFLFFTICWSIKKLMTSFVSISKTNMCWTLSDNCRIFPNCATMPEAVFLMRK